MRALLVLLLAACPAAAQTEAERSVTLAEAFAAAKARSEALAASEAGLAEARSRVRELVGTALPSLTLQGSEFLQDSAGSGGGVQGTFTRSDRPEAKLAFSQPLFTGFREYLSVRAASARGDAAELDLKRAASLLYRDTAKAYLDLLGVRRELSTRQATLDLTRERVKDLEARVKLGRSRSSELLAAKLQLARLLGQIPEVRGREEVAQEVLRFLTGWEGRLAPAEPVLAAATDVEAALRAARGRPDVEARRRERDGALFLSRGSRRERWPVVGLSGAWYLKRVGFQENIKWDMTFSASLPLFAGGQVGARVAQADARLKAAEFGLRGAERFAESEVRRAWAQLQSAVERTKALSEAAALAEQNAKAQSEDYKLGVVTNLDVLGALTQLQESRLDLEKVRLDAAWAQALLAVASGGPS